MSIGRMHTHAYYDAVNAMMLTAGTPPNVSRPKVLAVLNVIRAALETANKFIP